jgi:carboxymethylenebutenolidase
MTDMTTGRMTDMTTVRLGDDETVEAYVARPQDGSGDHPGVVLCIDALGLRSQIADMADRIASWGYVVLAPNVFHQYGTAAGTSPTEPVTTPEGRNAFFEGVRPRMEALFGAENREHLLADLASYVDVLHDLPGVSSGPVGVTGYCMGSRLAMLTAGQVGEGVAAVGGFHGGGLIVDGPLSPRHALPGARAEFWFGHADNDGSNTPENQRDLAKALDEAGLAHGEALYEGAPHGYTMADTSSYHEPSAERHYRDLRALLDRTLT